MVATKCPYCDVKDTDSIRDIGFCGYHKNPDYKTFDGHIDKAMDVVKGTGTNVKYIFHPLAIEAANEALRRQKDQGEFK